MNKLILSLSVLLCLVYTQSIAQQPGDVLWTHRSHSNQHGDTIYSIKVQSDGKMVAAGKGYNGLYRAIAVGRFDGDVLDPSFGNNGVVTTSLDSAHTIANAVEIQQDGKLVVAGGYRKGTVGDFILVRYKPNGALDSSFGVNGIARTDVGAGAADVATALAIQTDGNIVVAGRSGSSLALCRYKTNGTLDSTFDSDGRLTMTPVGAICMVLQANGKIVIGCGSIVIRLNPDGSLDSSFGANGISTLNNYCYGMAMQNDGKILLAGGSTQFVVERLDTAGTHDNGFGNVGVVTTNGFVQGSSSQGGGATSVCVQADGRILATGWARYSNGGLSRTFAVARYKTNGAPDSSFGISGKVGVPSAPAYGLATSFSAAINDNSELVLAGSSMNSSSTSGEWALVSYYLGPLLDVPKAPSGDRQITVAPNPVEDFARIQSTHIENGSWQLSLCDLTGKTLHTETILVTRNALDNSISLIGLPAATYLVSLDNGISRVTVKLTKSR